MPRKPSPSDCRIRQQDEDDEEDEEEADEDKKDTKEEEEEEDEVEQVETESEQGDQDEVSFPSPAQKENVTIRARGGHLLDKRTPPPTSKRQKLEASPSSEESPAPSAAATATPTTSSSIHQWQPTSSSRASQTPSTQWWLNSAMKREGDLVRQLAQSQGRSSVTRRSLSYAAPSSSSSSPASSSSSSASSSSSSASILASPSSAVAAAPPAGPSLASSSSSTDPATPAADRTDLTSTRQIRSTPVRERKSADDPASSPCSGPAPAVPSSDRSRPGHGTPCSEDAVDIAKDIDSEDFFDVAKDTSHASVEAHPSVPAAGPMGPQNFTFSVPTSLTKPRTSAAVRYSLTPQHRARTRSHQSLSFPCCLQCQCSHQQQVTLSVDHPLLVQTGRASFADTTSETNVTDQSS
eukprot:g18678.t1